MGLIELGERFRKDYGDQKEFFNLQQSILDHTLLEPVVVMPLVNGRYLLCAGGRRYKAFCLCGGKHIPFVIRNVQEAELTELEKLEGELEENLHRKDLSWPEFNTITMRIHEVKTKIHGIGKKTGGWTLKDTGEKVGVSAPVVHEKISLMQDLNNLPADVQKRLMLQSEAVAKREIDRIKKNKRALARIESGEVRVHGLITNEDALTLLERIPVSSVDMILTDPPYGEESLPIDGGEVKASPDMSIKNLIRPSDNLSIEDCRVLLQKCLPHFFRVLKPGSYCLQFFTFSNYQWLRTTMELLGFKVDHNPIIWDKTRFVQIPGGFSLPNSYEPILFAMKPPLNRKLNKTIKNIISCPTIPSTKRLHPFQKPPQLLMELIILCTHPGEIVLDPFAGSGSTIKAATDSGRQGLGSEVDKENWESAQRNLSSIVPQLGPTKSQDKLLQETPDA